jgi:hypothetical protein
MGPIAQFFLLYGGVVEGEQPSLATALAVRVS